jgi:hypothetical protein
MARASALRQCRETRPLQLSSAFVLLIIFGEV